MMKTDLNTKSINEQDEYFQFLSLKELKKINKESKFLFQNEGVISPEPEIESVDLSSIDGLIQKMQLDELKKLTETQDTFSQLDEYAITEKARVTGLDRNIILLIETKKEKATLEQIMIYCRKLRIPFQQFIPEFFMPVQGY